MREKLATFESTLDGLSGKVNDFEFKVKKIETHQKGTAKVEKQIVDIQTEQSSNTNKYDEQRHH
jgi:hypothetical protein